MIHVPGELFSVNPATARGVPGLFARNERVVCVFDGEPMMDTRAVRVGAGRAPPSSAAWPRCGTASSTRRARARCASGTTTSRRGRVEAGRGDGPLPARLHRRDAVPERHAELQSGMGTRQGDTPGRSDGSQTGLIRTLLIPRKRKQAGTEHGIFAAPPSPMPTFRSAP